MAIQNATNASTLANAVVYITANNLGLSTGLAAALNLTRIGLFKMSEAAFQTSSEMLQAFGLVGAALSIVTLGVFALTAAFGGLAAAGGRFEGASHNLEQVFGRWAFAAREAAEMQATAFGRSKSEFLDYVTTVGRQLEILGIGEKKAVEMAIELVNAASQLAESRRISFGEAFQQVQGRGALFSEDEVRGMAIQMGLLTNRNQILDSGTEALVRQRLAIDTIAMSTDASSESGDNWNSRLEMLKGTLANLAVEVGTDLLPAFVSFLTTVNTLVENAIGIWQRFHDVLVSMGVISEAIPADTADIDRRNEQHIAEARKRRIAGEAFGGNRGGTTGGFQGGLVEFARRVQQSAFNQRQMGLMERQLKAAEGAKTVLEQIADNLVKTGKNELTNVPAQPWF